jgi:hypothetical protein
MVPDFDNAGSGRPFSGPRTRGHRVANLVWQGGANSNGYSPIRLTKRAGRGFGPRTVLSHFDALQ